MCEIRNEGVQKSVVFYLSDCYSCDNEKIFQLVGSLSSAFETIRDLYVCI
jgi:hypothetical protein